MKTSEQLQELAQKTDKTWAKVLSTNRPYHQVRNCPSDLDEAPNFARAIAFREKFDMGD